MRPIRRFCGGVEASWLNLDRTATMRPANKAENTTDGGETSMKFQRRTILRGLASLAVPFPALVRAATAADKVKIGYLLKTMQEERYQRDKAAFLAKAKALGADVIFDSANTDEQTQLAAFENMLSQGAQGIVL